VLVQELARDPDELRARAHDARTLAHELPERHWRAGQVERPIRRAFDRLHKESGHVLHVHELDVLVTVPRSDVATTGLRAAQPGEEVRRGVTVPLDGAGPHDGQLLLDQRAQASLALGLAAVV
jgi:hypothetical protein